MRRSYKGNAVATTLATTINSSSLAATLVDGSGLPDGTFGPFVITLDSGVAGEEKILATSRSGNSLVINTRGWDGTSASSHSSGASVRHTYSATDADEANAHVNAATGVHGVTGAVVGTTDTQNLSNKTLVNALGSLGAAATIGGVSGTQIAAEYAAWTAWTPVTSNVTSGTFNARYRTVGKTMYVHVQILSGTATATSGSIAIYLNGGVGGTIIGGTTGVDQALTVAQRPFSTTVYSAFCTGSQSKIDLLRNWTAGDALNGITISGVIEIA